MNEQNNPSQDESVAVTEPVEAKDSTKTQEPRYTDADINEAIEKAESRLAYKHRKEIDDLKKKVEGVTKSKGNANVEEELRQQIAKYEDGQKVLSDRLSKLGKDVLRGTIERELHAQNCFDPEVVIDHFLARNKVELDDDGKIVVHNRNGKLSDLVSDFLATKPNLVLPSVGTGAGTKGPKAAPSTDSTSKFADKSVEEMEAELGIDLSHLRPMKNRK
jgi:hypothetical protein